MSPNTVYKKATIYFIIIQERGSNKISKNSFVEKIPRKNPGNVIIKKFPKKFSRWEHFPRNVCEKFPEKI